MFSPFCLPPLNRYGLTVYDVTSVDKLNGVLNISLTTAVVICLCVAAYLFNMDATKVRHRLWALFSNVEYHFHHSCVPMHSPSACASPRTSAH